MSRATSQSEHLKDMLGGNILAVSWLEVGKTAALYALIGIFHYVFRRQFLAISIDHARPNATVCRSGSGTSCSTPRSASS
jgi:ABC-type Mn2+/Zn2+ transport system permease subunit